MRYPTLEEIGDADRVQIARWYRSLPMPGVNHLSGGAFLEWCNIETFLMIQINKRFEELGGWTPELSEIVGSLRRGIN